ncbi:AAEL013267-PA [Aedes aegypti]|uniref:Glycosyltransferase family 92 protein n=1 Tax=Aedes aegypti TaxID=7159 RepID=Q16JN6_AEDAE|nr:AAEL013267-PA [Aedes aegypti]
MIRSTSEESDRDAATEMRSHIRYHPLKSRSKAFVLASAVFSNTFIRKYGIFSVILCLGLGYLFYTRVLYQQYIYQTLPLYQKSIRLRLGHSENFSNQIDRWKPIGNQSDRLQIFSAFFDPRLEIVHNFRVTDGTLPFGSVRIFSILPLRIRRQEVYCHFKYASNRTVWHRADQVESIHENFGMEFSASYVVCKLVGNKHQVDIELPVEVGITYGPEETMVQPTSFVGIHYPSRHQGFLLRTPPSRKLAICVGPAHHNYSNAARIVEFVEYWKLLGAERFYFYNKSITAEVDRVMSYYRERNVAEVLQWNLEGYEFEQELRYEGIFAALNDCLYRATLVGDFHYTALVDFDEFLLPLFLPTNATTVEETLVQYLDRRGRFDVHSFNFETVFFYGFYEEDYSQLPEWGNNTYLYTQVRTLRTKKPLMHHNRSKYVAVGRNVIEAGNHFVWQAMKDTSELRVPEAEGLLFHYRELCIGYGCETFVEDARARRFSNEIYHSVNTVCKRLFPETAGICPLGSE